MRQLVTISNHRGEITYELASFGERLGARFIDVLIIVIPNTIIPIIPAWLYWAFQQSSESQATLGQKAFRIKVVDSNGTQVGFGQATGRFFGNFLNILTFFAGFFMFFFNDKNQCLHDFVSNCIVVKATEVERRLDKIDNISKHLVE